MRVLFNLFFIGSLTTVQAQYYYIKALTTPAYEFEANIIMIFNDNSARIEKGIYNSNLNKVIVTNANGEKNEYGPQDLKEITLMFGSSGKRHKAISTNGVFLFKNFSGQINAYSTTPSKYKKNIIAIQLESGPIVELTKTNLEQMMPDKDKELNRLINSNDLIGAVKYYNKKAHK